MQSPPDNEWHVVLLREDAGEARMGRIDGSIPRMLDKIMPELPLTNVAAGVVYCRDALGFSVNYQQTLP
jgi:hypothetical protein